MNGTFGASGAIAAELDRLAEPERAAHSQRFFKTGPGEYGEGDTFIGLTVPQQRRVARAHREASLRELDSLLASEVHEHRLTALIVLTLQFERANAVRREELADFYLLRRNRVNNWDLVDASARILLHDKVRTDARGLLDPLLASESVWDRRIAVLATFSLIREGQFAEAMRCCRVLLDDDHDLIHKATGWMLREIGNRDEAALRDFLDQHAGVMPRTMLRYAIERLNPDDRSYYMRRAAGPGRAAGKGL